MRSLGRRMNWDLFGVVVVVVLLSSGSITQLRDMVGVLLWSGVLG